MIAREKLLIVNADDFGFTRGVNDGIVESHVNGILTAATLMANGPEFEHAAALARQHPSLDIGCHLVLVGGASLLPPHRPYPLDLKGLLRALWRKEFRIEAELEAQVQRIIHAGIRPTHLDTHKHTHLLPPVLDVVARLSRKYSIPWVRRPFDFPITGPHAPLGRRLLSRSLDFMRRRFQRALSAQGCRTTDHFAGFSVTGLFHTAELTSLLRQIPCGVTEFMTHPGFCNEELRRAPTRLKESRARELEALCAPETREALTQFGIRLVNYRDLQSR
ncbi:MAG TPA: ChbG/HpnK family deacetylase [Bryobacteraceae bacterium]|nr:ChbG/HpnK family deacetylase [Bryobacteraceae bacterium]